MLNSSTIDKLGEWCLQKRVRPWNKPSRTRRVSMTALHFAFCYSCQIARTVRNVIQIQKWAKSCKLVRKKCGNCMAFLLTITISRYFQATYFPKQLRNHVPLLSSCKIIKAFYIFSLAWVLVSVLLLDASDPNFCWWMVTLVWQ